jgi:hypothetical protein
MQDTYSFNDIMNASVKECYLLLNYLFINTENDMVLGYLCAKYPSDIKNGGHIKFISPCGTYFHKIYGNHFIKNSKILKIVKE